MTQIFPVQAVAIDVQNLFLWQLCPEKRDIMRHQMPRAIGRLRRIGIPTTHFAGHPLTDHYERLRAWPAKKPKAWDLSQLDPFNRGLLPLWAQTDEDVFFKTTLSIMGCKPFRERLKKAQTKHLILFGMNASECLAESAIQACLFAPKNEMQVIVLKELCADAKAEAQSPQPDSWHQETVERRLKAYAVHADFLTLDEIEKRFAPPEPVPDQGFLQTVRTRMGALFSRASSVHGGPS